MDIQDMIEDWKKQTEDTTYIFESKIAAAYRADVILSDAQQEFKRLSSIFNKKDITFLVIASILHGCSKIIIRKMRRMKDSDLAKINPFHSEEHSNRANTMYYCSYWMACINNLRLQGLVFPDSIIVSVLLDMTLSWDC